MAIDLIKKNPILEIIEMFSTWTPIYQFMHNIEEVNLMISKALKAQVWVMSNAAKSTMLTQVDQIREEAERKIMWNLER